MRSTIYAAFLGLSLLVIADEALTAKRHSPTPPAGVRQVRTIELSPAAKLIPVYPGDELALGALGERKPTKKEPRLDEGR